MHSTAVAAVKNVETRAHVRSDRVDEFIQQKYAIKIRTNKLCPTFANPIWAKTWTNASGRGREGAESATEIHHAFLLQQFINNSNSPRQMVLCAV